MKFLKDILVASHGGTPLDNGGTNEVSIWIKFRGCNISSVEDDLSTIIFSR